MTTITESPAAVTRASDADRERAEGVLRDGWMAGRLDEDELEERVREVWEARYVSDLWDAVRELPARPHAEPAPLGAPEPFPAAALGSVLIGGLGALVLLGSLMLGWFLALPLGGTAWLLGRNARRGPTERGTKLGTAGEALGVFVTLLALVGLAGCAAFVAAS